MKFPKITQKCYDLANKIWQKAKQPISFVISLMTKKFTPAAISVGLAFLLIEKTYTTVSEYVKMVLEKEVAVAASSVVLTAFILLLIAILTYTIINWSVAYITKFFKGQIAEIKMLWQLSKMPSHDESKQITPSESLTGNVEKIETIKYSRIIEIIEYSHYGKQSKLNAIRSGKLKDTGGYTIEEPYGLQNFLNGIRKTRIKTAEEVAEDSKAMMLYDKIFQEFFGNNSYDKSNVEIVESKLRNFLRTKELELQNKIFAEIN